MVEVTDFFPEEEEFEEGVNNYVNTGYPKPVQHYRLLLQKDEQSLEEAYFWALNFFRHGVAGAFNHIVKVTDTFSSSEQSAYFGASQQRLGLQQDKISQFLATIGKMVKELFQLVREIRVIDERMDLYGKSYANDHAADIALKGYWIDLVEGGAKNPASVYGMAREIGFATLPDLFFGAPPSLESRNVQTYVNNLEFNKKMKEVLMRKLKTYIVWKEHTHKELKNRRNFTIKFLRQHWAVIHMYITWVKPYLKNVQRMSRLQSKDIDRDPEIVSSFDGAVTEVEFLAMNAKPKEDKYTSCILINFWFRTTPKLDIHAKQEYHHKGPVHVGKLVMNIRAYGWTKQDVDNYLRMREEESMELLGNVDSSVKAAMDSLGDELRQYLIESGEKDLLPPKAEKTAQEKAMEKRIAGNPFSALLGGFGEIFGSLVGAGGPKTVKLKSEKRSRKQDFQLGIKLGSAEGVAKKVSFAFYKIFKKAHKMLAW